MQENEINELVEQLQKQVSAAEQQNEIKESPVFSWTLEQLCEATGGDYIGPLSELGSIRFNSVSTDTRTLQPGALYIAVKGERFDGHAFIDQAIQQGAVAVLVSEELDTAVPGVLVDDSRLALGAFALWHRTQMPVKKLIAVTGSNGKTSVKTLLNGIFSSVGETLATEGNLNNDFGVPRTLLNLRPEHEYAIIEMGANHPKEIAYLTALALPDIAIINNAAGAHLEGFGSLQGVIDTKGEIFQGLNRLPGKEPGVAVLNTDSAGFDDWLKILDNLGVERRIKFGTQAAADVCLSDFQVSQSEADGITFNLQFDGESHLVQMPILGRHNAMNAAACTAVGIAAGLNWSQIKPALQNFTGVPGRLQKNRIKTGWLIDDSYNANPESVKAGIDALTSLPGQAMVCLGAMAEVGETSDQAHREIAEYAKQNGVQYLFVYGEAAQEMPLAFGENADDFVTHSELLARVAAILSDAQQNNLPVNVLVKGSRSAKMELIAQPLLDKYKP